MDLVVGVCQNVITDQQITFKAWQDYYNIVYTWCVRPEDRKRELYHLISTYFEEIAKVEEKKLKDKRKESLLREYLRRLNNFTSATTKIKNLFAYMHRYWIPAQHTNGDTSVKDVYELSLIKWKQCVYQPLSKRLLDALLLLVSSDRSGDTVDKTILANMTQSYLTVGIDDAKSPLEFYKREFQEPFIKDTRAYYTKESDNFLIQNSVSEYMKKAEIRLTQEEALAQQYLHPTSKEELIKCCEDVFVEKHMQFMQDEFPKMLRDDKLEDLKRFYGLLSRVPNGLQQSAASEKQYLIELATKITTEQAKSLGDRASIVNSVNLILELLKLHQKYSEIIKSCFSDHHFFRRSLDEAFIAAVNKNVGVFTMAEILNFYVDYLLKGNEKLPEDQLEERMDSTVKLFTYFDDKDLFYAAFRKALSKRLLSKKYKEDAERHFIAKLKQNCGDVYTKKLEGMFNDVKVSDERIPQFKAYCDKKGVTLEYDMQVSVLNDLYWPLSKQTEFNLPKELVPGVKIFESFYATYTDKRSLTWLYNQGTMILNHVLLDEKMRKRKIELTVSCMQACILLLYNEHKTYKYREVREILGTTDEMLKFSIIPLVFSKMRIIANLGVNGQAKQNNEDDGDGEDEPPKGISLKDDDVLQLCPLKTGGKLKIAYPPGHVAILGSEREGMVKKNMEERVIKIELALVRVMKIRGTLKQQELIAEATKQLAKFFKPDPRLMKKRIENLMERGFMRRDEDDQTVIHYQA
eukprot:TRINITY_DN21220_c0_g1_i1.p1 TRINITY_DN21220_c0_g1~~TRINITY_DN21220_c0_g1_i1.p1  ORF type:complete len:773 (-),score=194.52 TRINITY_DN21220_c0_g1_i1:2-2242(-)